MIATTKIQHRKATRKKHPENHNRAAIEYAVRVIYRVCCLAGSARLINDIRDDLDSDGVRTAIKTHDTAVVFDWLIAALSYQGTCSAARRPASNGHCVGCRPKWPDQSKAAGPPLNAGAGRPRVVGVE
jgi:hypothetical protein